MEDLKEHLNRFTEQITKAIMEGGSRGGPGVN
jgi:hypothetical protein